MSDTNNTNDRGNTMTTPTTIRFDDTEYVRADAAQPARTHEDYVIVRSDRSGVFAGHLVEHDRATGHVVLADARRLWYWIGASLSQVALQGAIEPGKCKYAVPLEAHVIATVIEVMPCTEAAMQSIKAVPSWER